MSDEQTVAANQAAVQMQSLRQLATIVYVLQAVAFLIWPAYVAAVVIDHLKIGEAQHSWLQSHFRWQMRTFWFSLLWFSLGLLTFFVYVGWFVLIGNSIWVIYRIVKGWLRLSDGKPMYLSP